MSTKNLSDYIYNQRLRIYNDERREYAGFNNVTMADGALYWDNSGATLQLFTIDCTQDIDTPITLCSYANGVKLKYTYDSSTYVPALEGQNHYSISLRLQYYDSEDNAIEGYQDMTNITFDNRYYNPTAAKFYFSPPGFQYRLEYGDNPVSMFEGVIFSAGGYKPFSSAPPDISGRVKYTDIRDYWNAYTFNLRYDLSGFFDFILGHGDDTPISPQLPAEDTSGPGGGASADPDYNPYSDSINFPDLPTYGSAIDSGFIRVYNPTAGQLQSLANRLWSSDFINTVYKIMNDPMEAMISLHSVPFQVVGSGSQNIMVGNYNSEISARVVSVQYYTLDCGNISLPEHWASALDYSPYTTVDIFIPFVGVRPLQIDDVMGKVLNLKYNIDILTGSAIAMLKCGDSVLYTYNTQIHTEIPYTMSSYGRLVQSIIGVAGAAVGAAAGGAGAIIGGGIGGALGTAMTKHSDISRGGALGGTVGIMGDFTPYLIIHRPIQSLAGDFASKKGYPSNISATLGSVSGYTVVDKIHLTGIDCTDTERDEIHALLKDGVII